MQKSLGKFEYIIMCVVFTKSNKNPTKIIALTALTSAHMTSNFVTFESTLNAFGQSDIIIQLTDRH